MKNVFNNKDILYTDHYKNYFLKMEKDKLIYFGDSNIDIKGSEKEVAKFIDDFLNERIIMILTTKPSPKPTLKLTKKNLKKLLN